MNIIYWNCRGFENRATQRVLFNYCRSLHPSLVCLAEPKVVFESICSSFWRSVNLSFVTATSSTLPNMWILISNDLGAGNIDVFLAQINI